MAADGSIILEPVIDDRKAQSALNRLVKRIEELGHRLERLKSERVPLVEKADALVVKLDEAKAKLYEMQNASIGTYSKEEIDNQADKVRWLQSEWDSAQAKVEQYDRRIKKTTEDLEDAEGRAGDLSKQLVEVGDSGNVAGEKISLAMQLANKKLERLGHRITSMLRRIFVLSLFTKVLGYLRSWFVDVIKSNDEAAEALGRLKGAFLTLAQPIIEVVIPVLVKLLNVLAQVVSAVASLVARLFGTTAKNAAESAENLYKEQKAIKGVGNAAKKASTQLAAFDQLNVLGSEDSGSGSTGGTGEIEPIFDQSWIGEQLTGIEDKVTAALLLGGVALIAIGAAMGNLGLVIAGLALIGTAIEYGTETGVLEDWAKKLGLERAEELVTAALLVAGIAAVVIGICTGNILLFLAGAALIGAGLVYGEENGVSLEDWVRKLGLDDAEGAITAALLIAGIAAVVIGICTGNILMFIAGAGLIGAGIVYGNSNEVFTEWAEALGLNDVFDYVVAAIQLVGIALIAIGAAMANIGMVIAGGIILAVGIAADAIGEERLAEWWQKLKLTTVGQWITVVSMLAGVALIAIGAAMANIFMVLIGLTLIGISMLTNSLNPSEQSIKDWVTVLGLEKVAGWVTAALLLGGIALLVIGMCTGNIPMVIAGLGLLGAGVAIGNATGTFDTWLGPIEESFTTFKNKIVETFEELRDGVKGVINSVLGFIEGMANGVVRGVNKVIDAINGISFTVPDWVPGVGGNRIGFNLRKLAEVSIPRLAEGAVIPPNREFLAVLGDQKRGTNIETPLDTMIQAFKAALNESGYGDAVVNLYLDGEKIASNTVKHINKAARAGGKVAVI